MKTSNYSFKIFPLSKRSFITSLFVFPVAKNTTISSPGFLGQRFNNLQQADQGGCYPQRPKGEVDNTLRNVQNSSYPTKSEFNTCFIIHSKCFLLLKGVSPLRSLFSCSPNITQPCPQVFSVNGLIICSGLHF